MTSVNPEAQPLMARPLQVRLLPRGLRISSSSAGDGAFMKIPRSCLRFHKGSLRLLEGFFEDSRIIEDFGLGLPKRFSKASTRVLQGSRGGFSDLVSRRTRIRISHFEAMSPSRTQPVLACT